MAESISRMQFLRGDFRGADPVLRPPWSVVESRFIELCNQCGDCLPVCPTSILVKGRGGFPVVDFTKGECEFCGNCTSVCKSGALSRSDESDESPWLLKAVVNGNKCIAHQGVVCRSCGDQCESRAITFRLIVGRVPQPQLHDTTCNGCGACVAPCPVNAISVVIPT